MDVGRAKVKLQKISTQIRIRTRISSRLKRVVYIGALGEANLGDEAMIAALRDSLPGAAVLPLDVFSCERILAKMNLSGPGYFSHVILGGGTLISPYWLAYVERVEPWNLPILTSGTGVGSSGFAEKETELMQDWVPHLRQFKGLGVRGPRSQAKLRAAGLSQALAVGDLAHLYAGKGTTNKVSSKKLAVNIVLPEGETYATTSFASLKQLEPVVGDLVRQGWEIVPISMHARDDEPTKQFVQAATGNVQQVHRPPTYEDFAALVRDCTCTYSVRLHGAILSTCVGTPPLMLGYRDKCADFMDAMELQPWYVDMSLADGDGIVEKARALTSSAAQLRPVILERALDWKKSLNSYFQEQISRN